MSFTDDDLEEQRLEEKTMHTPMSAKEADAARINTKQDAWDRLEQEAAVEARRYAALDYASRITAAMLTGYVTTPWTATHRQIARNMTIELAATFENSLREGFGNVDPVE